MIPTDLHRSGSSSHSAGRRQGDVDERYSAAVDRDGIGMAKVNRARLSSVRGLSGSVLRVLRVEQILLDFYE